MTRLFLHFLNVAATFRIWSSGKKNPYFKYVSSHFLTLAIELHVVRFGEVPLLHLNYIARYRPHLRCCYYFAWQKKIYYCASSGLTNL